MGDCTLLHGGSVWKTQWCSGRETETPAKKKKKKTSIPGFRTQCHLRFCPQDCDHGVSSSRPLPALQNLQLRAPLVQSRGERGEWSGSWSIYLDQMVPSSRSRLCVFPALPPPLTYTPPPRWTSVLRSEAAELGVEGLWCTQARPPSTSGL